MLSILTPVAPMDAIWECFNVSQVNVINQGFRLYTDNFGGQRARVTRGYLTCEHAFELTGIGVSNSRANGEGYECYTIQARTPRTASG